MNTLKAIVIPFTLPWDWSADFQRQTCFELSKKHTVYAYMQKDAVFYLKALFKKYPQHPTVNNIIFYRPLYLFPFRRVQIIEKINHVISYKLFELFVLKRQNIILWIFDPEFYLLPCFATNTISIYDCVDYHAGFHKKKSKKNEQHYENELIRSVQYFFVNTKTLFSLHKKTRIAQITEIGFRARAFVVSQRASLKFPQNKPILGFVGALDERMDYKLLISLISRNPQWTFALWGPTQVDEKYKQKILKYIETLQKFPNVIMGVSRDPREIPSIIKQFSVGIIPYDMRHDGVKYCFPMKLLEFLYLGKQVVSAPILEVIALGRYVKIAQSSHQWEQQITLAISSSYSKRDRHYLKTLVLNNSWEKKISTILDRVDN